MSGVRLWDPSELRQPHQVPDKSRRVRAMFDAIAPRYELVNSLFSCGLDAYWRAHAVRLASVRATDQVLDVACGTGDFARSFLSVHPARVIGCDFAHEMLQLAKARPSKASTRSGEASRRLELVEADALRLPFADGSFSIVSCAFGVRNFANLDRGLREMRRILTKQGRAVILEFTRPRPVLIRRVYELYANYIMPVAASWVSGDRTGAYHYLPHSVISFHDAEQMKASLKAAGFGKVTATPLTFGIVTIYVACCN